MVQLKSVRILNCAFINFGACIDNTYESDFDIYGPKSIRSNIHMPIIRYLKGKNMLYIFKKVNQISTIEVIIFLNFSRHPNKFVVYRGKDKVKASENNRNPIANMLSERLE